MFVAAGGGGNASATAAFLLAGYPEKISECVALQSELS